MSERLIEKVTDQLEECKSDRIARIRQQVPNTAGKKAKCECGDVIPTARRAHGYENCIECAQLNERVASIYSKQAF